MKKVMKPTRRDRAQPALRLDPVYGAVALALGSMTVGDAAHAANETFLEELVVTASRRDTGTQDIPINIAAFGGEALTNQGIDDLAEFARWVPGLSLIDQGARTADTLTVRGITASSIDASELLGNGSGNTVGTYLGEVPLYIDLRPIDIDRVEVLIGPQGTLYGEGTLAGAVRYIPKKARTDEFTLDVSGQAFAKSHSDDAGWSGELTLNAPIVEDELAFRGTLAILQDPGFVDYDFLVNNPGVSNPEPDFTNPVDVAQNLFSKEDVDDNKVISARLALLWEIAGSGELELAYHFQEQNVRGRTVTNSASFDTDSRAAGYRFIEPIERENQLLSATLIWDYNSAELTTAVGYSMYEEQGQRDQTDLLLNIGYTYPDFPSFAAFTDDRWEDETLTIESRLVSTHEGPWDWIVGAFYSDLDNHQDSQEFTPGFPEFLGIAPPPLPTGDLEFQNVVDEDILQIAVYGELGYQVNDRWHVTVGARAFHYDDDISQTTDFPLFGSFGTPFVAQFDDGDVIFKFNTSLDLDGWVPGMDGGLSYFTISEGYRLGGINAIDPCDDPVNPTQTVCAFPDEQNFETDTTVNYEIGFKTAWLDSRLTADLSLFYVDWNDVQIGTITLTGNVPITSNSSDAKSQGIEFSTRWQITDNWSLYGAYAFTNAELTEDAPNSVGVRTPPDVAPNLPVDAFKGDRLPGTPENQGSLNINYARDLTQALSLILDYGFTSIGNVYTKTGLRGSGEILPGFTLHNASVSLAGDAWSLMLWARNLTDKYALTGVRRDTAFIDKRADGNGIRNPGEQFTLRQYHHNIQQPRTVGLDFRYSFDFQ